MRFLLSLIILLNSFNYLSSQNLSLEAKIHNFDAQRVYLACFRSGETVLLDSASVLEGKFMLPLKGEYKPGIYSILLGESDKSGFPDVDPVYFDFIFNAENVRLESDYDSLIVSMKIISSAENEIFYTYLKRIKQYNYKFFMLKSLLNEYSLKDSFYTNLSNEFIDIQQNNSQKLIELVEKLPGSIASSVIKMNLLPIIHPSIKGSALSEFYREHYFDLVSFGDERLINSKVYDKKIMEYLGFFKNPALTSQEQEQAFILGVDNIMDKASLNPVIYDYVLNFLIDSFDKLKYELVLVHIAENYIEGGCETDSKKLLEKRLEGYKKMGIGNKAPDIIMLDENGKQVRLYELKNDYILVLFWASWCPHCTNMLPHLKKWYETRPINLQIFAVSIDSSRFAWEESLMMNNFSWINTCTFAGWNDKAARDYNLYATPTMFLLDRSHKIIAKPMTFREFRKEVDKL